MNSLKIIYTKFNFKFLFALAMFPLLSVAQKLPNKQVASIRAPVDIKIDGKTTEWGGKFQAYNIATDLYYTIANDDKRLYLIVQSKNQQTINNIINGGVRINIQKNGYKNDVGSVGVKFPYFEKGKRVTFILRHRGEIPPDKAAHVADSIMKSFNKRLLSNVKWIYTNGIFGTDSLMPIYNESGIEAANAFDNKKIYTCELGIELKLLSLSTNKNIKFAYHIIANAEPNKFLLSDTFGGVSQGKNADGSPMSKAEIDKAMALLKGPADNQNATTDFWGDYTLAK